ncbi:MAG: TRZ/ATZ family hydrolase [Methylococcaceae bacterium]|nr:MAG: TRZ/ATZ family hydrolase [Methylococcaceae bacterium]
MIVDAILHARWIVPVEPDGVVLENHALVLDGGRIKDLLPHGDALQRYQAGSVEHFDRHVLLPGLVNAHSHAAMTLLRGRADDLPLMNWLNDHIWPLERQWMGVSFVQDGVDLAMAEMLRGGTTCFNDMYFFPEIAARRVLHAGMRAAIGLILIDFPTAWAENPDEYFSKNLALFDEIRHEPLLQTTFAPHAPYSVSDGPLQRLRTLAAELDKPVHMHVHETRDEVRQSLQTHGMRPLQRLEQLELIGPQFIAVHMTQLDDAEISRYAATGAHMVHCPESNLKLASGFCPLAKLLAAGVNVALGTDGAASNNDLDMFGEMRTAALLAKGVASDAAAVPAHTALRMATLNGARALGLEREIGSLEAGKSADLIAVSLDELETRPLFDPVSHLVYAASRRQVSDAWVAGKRLLRQRQLTTLDIDGILARADHWQAKLAGKH